MLLDAARRSGTVIACGGGIVTQPENFDPMRRNSAVVFLRRDLALLPSAGRPLSQRDGPEKLYRQRKPLYEKAADFAVDNITVEGAVSDIMSIIRRLSK